MNDCEALAKAVGWLSAVALPLHTAPFFFCARAVFNRNNFMIAFFAMLWIGTLGGSLVSPFFIHAAHIGPTKRCLVDTEIAYSAGIASVALNNTLTFFSICFHLSWYTQAETLSGRFNDFIHRRGSGGTSTLMKESGQQFVMCVSYATFRVPSTHIRLCVCQAYCRLQHRRCYCECHPDDCLSVSRPLRGSQHRFAKHDDSTHSQTYQNGTHECSPTESPHLSHPPYNRVP